MTLRRILEFKMINAFKLKFQDSLKKRPITTNVATYATFYMAAECTQQTFNKFYTPEKPNYNIPAAARITAVGSGIYAPTLYFWYKFLDKNLPGKAIKTVVAKVACDQLLMTPILLAAFFTVLSILERRDDIFEELRMKYWKAFIANQSFWIPAQFVNFLFIPPHLRVTYVATASFLWINVLCFIKRMEIEPAKAAEK